MICLVSTLAMHIVECCATHNVHVKPSPRLTAYGSPMLGVGPTGGLQPMHGLPRIQAAHSATGVAHSHSRMPRTARLLVALGTRPTSPGSGLMCSTMLSGHMKGGHSVLPMH